MGLAIHLHPTPSDDPTSYSVLDKSDIGDIVGYADAVTGKRGFLWSNGLIKDIGSLPGGVDESFASAIANNGLVVGDSSAAGGTHAFSWRPGNMLDLGTLPGRNNSNAVVLSEFGQIVGSSNADNELSHGFVWQEGVMKDLGDLPGGLDESFANDINPQLLIVGSSSSSLGDRAVLSRGFGDWQDINGMLDPISGIGWTLTTALAINDLGDIVGLGLKNGVLHGVLLRERSVVPEPGGIDTFRTWLGLTIHWHAKTMSGSALTKNDFLFDVYCVMSALTQNYMSAAKEDFDDAFASVETCQELSDEGRHLAKHALDYAEFYFRQWRNAGEPGGIIDAVIVLGIAYRAIATNDLKQLTWLFANRPPLVRSEAPDSPSVPWSARIREGWHAIRARFRG